MKKLSVFFGAVVFVFGVVGNLNAALIDRGGGLIYDSDQDITWLQDANYANTSGYDDALYGYDTNGGMEWDDAVAWADQLVFGGYDDWRLTTTVDGPYDWGYDGTTTGGFNITTSEFGYMYYVNLGNVGMYATDGTVWPPGGHTLTPGPFINLQYFFGWSGTESGTEPDSAWCYDSDTGGQSYQAKQGHWYKAWAVRDGDVSAVPVPGAVWLLGSGLIGLVGFRKKIRREA